MEIKFNDVTLIINLGTPLEKTILNNVSFKLSGNKIYGILGNQNSGKTCIGQLISALIKPTKGSVCVNEYVNNGRRIKNVNKLRLMVGYVNKNPYDMFICKSVKKELEFGMKYFKYKLEKIKLRPIDALKMVGLSEEYMDKDPLELNLSDAKKLALACTIIYNPKVIILDEPTIGLNYQDRRELVRLLKILKDRYNKMIIILSKDTDFLYSISDYTYVFDRSSLVLEGNFNIYKEYQVFNNLGLKIPDIVNFIEIAKSKGINLRNYNDIKDLVKGVCNNVF